MTEPTNSSTKPTFIPTVQLLEEKLEEQSKKTSLKRKMKILWISDFPLSTSGVGVQANELIMGMLATGKYSFKCIGAAIKHSDYNTIYVGGNQDYVIKPVDGFGNHQMIRQILLTERPDAVVIFTDPHQFMWLWEIEDEIHQICPIAYWHIWDNDPYPAFNKVWYESTDLINCISWKTYELVQPNFPDKTNYIPHAWKDTSFFPLDPQLTWQYRQGMLGAKADWFVGLWVNRNAGRKMPGDVLNGWKMFLDKLEQEEGHRRGLLIMHTDPHDVEGPNLLEVQKLLGLENNVIFSTDRIEQHKMNVLYNIVDFGINVSRAEGWSLFLTGMMQVGKPMIASLTGGMIRQMINHKDGTVHGVAIKPAARTLIGSQQVPYIYDDNVDVNDVAEAYYTIYKMPLDVRLEVGQRAREYILEECSYDNVVKRWDETLEECILKFKQNKKDKKPNWTIEVLNSSQEKEVLPPMQSMQGNSKFVNQSRLPMGR